MIKGYKYSKYTLNARISAVFIKNSKKCYTESLNKTYKY